MECIFRDMISRNPVPSGCLPGWVIFVAFASLSGVAAWGEEPGKADAAQEREAIKSLPTGLEEARGRAKWLHEIIHGSLQVMHRDFFGDGNDGENDTLSLPSQSLDDVFREMERSWRVEIRWLNVNAGKGKDHEPQDPFEEAAVLALKQGDTEHEAVEKDRYRFVGAIRLQNQCLKCHVPYRKSLEDRVAGLAISFPIQPEAQAP